MKWLANLTSRKHIALKRKKALQVARNNLSHKMSQIQMKCRSFLFGQVPTWAQGHCFNVFFLTVPRRWKTRPRNAHLGDDPIKYQDDMPMSPIERTGNEMYKQSLSVGDDGELFSFTNGGSHATTEWSGTWCYLWKQLPKRSGIHTGTLFVLYTSVKVPWKGVELGFTRAEWHHSVGIISNPILLWR